VVGRHEVSAEGKALRFYEVAEFDEHLTPQRVTQATHSLRTESKPDGKVKR